MSLKDQFKAAKVRKYHPVDMSKFPQFPPTVFVKTMTGTDLNAYGKLVVKYKDKEESWHRPILLAMTVCDEQGNLLFDENEVDTMNDEYDGVPLYMLYNESSKINYMTEEAMDEAKKN